MKKLGLVVSMLLCALVMVSCANATGGKGADSKAEVSVSGVPNGLYKLEKQVNPSGTLEGEALEQFISSNPLFYINYVNGKCDLVGKGQDGSFKVTVQEAGVLNTDNTYEMTVPPATELTKGTWKYENNALEITFKMGDESVVSTYKKFAEAIQK